MIYEIRRVPESRREDRRERLLTNDRRRVDFLSALVEKKADAIPLGLAVPF